MTEFHNYYWQQTGGPEPEVDLPDAEGPLSLIVVHPTDFTAYFHKQILQLIAGLDLQDVQAFATSRGLPECFAQYGNEADLFFPEGTNNRVIVTGWDISACVNGAMLSNASYLSVEHQSLVAQQGLDYYLPLDLLHSSAFGNAATLVSTESQYDTMLDLVEGVHMFLSLSFRNRIGVSFDGHWLKADNPKPTTRIHYFSTADSMVKQMANT